MHRLAGEPFVQATVASSLGLESEGGSCPYVLQKGCGGMETVAGAGLRPFRRNPITTLRPRMKIVNWTVASTWDVAVSG